MLEGNDVLSLRCTRVKDLGQTTDLQGWALLDKLFIGLGVPLGWHGETCVGLLNALQVDDFLVKVLNLLLRLLELIIIGSFAIPRDQSNVSFSQWHALVIGLLVLVVLLLLCCAALGVNLLLLWHFCVCLFV